MSNLMNVIKKELETNDQIRHEYRAGYEGKEGELVLTNKKIIFITKSGFFKPHYTELLEIPYDDITKMTAVASHRIEFTTEAHTYELVSFGQNTAVHIKKEVTALKDMYNGK